MASNFVSAALDTHDHAASVDFLKLWPRVAVLAFHAVPTVLNSLGHAFRIAGVLGNIVVSQDGGHDITHRKAFGGAINDRCGLKAGFFRQFRRDIFRSVNDDLSRPSLVSVLNFTSSPYTILRRVRARIIHSFNRMSFGARSHILNEVLERTVPPVADRNPTAAIVFKVRNVWVSAPLLHVCPSAVEWVRVLKRHILTFLLPRDHVTTNPIGVN